MLRAVAVFFANTWVCGLRSRAVRMAFILGLFMIGLAYLAGFFSPRQPRTVALDVGFSMLRLALVLLAVFWLQEQVGREIERRTVLFALTFPVPRAAYVLGRYLGVLALLGAALLIDGLLLWLAVLTTGPIYMQQFPPQLGGAFFLTLLGIWLDVAVVAAFTLWIATLATVPVLPMALGLVFAVITRGMGAVFEYLLSGAGGDKALIAHYLPILDVLQWFVPDLSRLDWRIWPLYGVPLADGVMGWAVVMALAYVGFMLVAAVIAFSRREFA